MHHDDSRKSYRIMWVINNTCFYWCAFVGSLHKFK